MPGLILVVRMLKIVFGSFSPPESLMSAPTSSPGLHADPVLQAVEQVSPETFTLFRVHQKQTWMIR